MKFTLAAAAIAGTEASTLGITWKDCHAKHTTVTDLQPTTIKTGTQATLTGSATVDEAVASATFSAIVKAHGVQVAKCSGDGLSDIVCKLPLGAGAITVAAINYPMGPGAVSLDVHVQTRARLPSSLATVDAHIAAEDGNGEGVVCLDVHTQAAKEAIREEQPTFKEWAATFGKVYDGEEATQREAVYAANVALMDEHNSGSSTFTMGVNQFSDLTQDEFAAMPIRGFVPGESSGLAHLGTHEETIGKIATAVDWRNKGAVTAVKNQGQCGSCWSFSTTGSMEGAWQIATGSLQPLSEQQLVDCDGGILGNKGCNGGMMDRAFSFYKGGLFHGPVAIATEESYAYTAKVGTCKTSYTTAIPAGSVTGYKDVKGASGLMSALNQQPVSIAIEADQSSFQHYKTGILDSGCGTQLDHGVMAVGYDSAEEYFLVKNSWGPSWGDGGYIKISSKTNVCGVSSMPSYPVVSGADSIVV